MSRIMLRTYVPRPQQTEKPARPSFCRGVRLITLRMNTGRGFVSGMPPDRVTACAATPLIFTAEIRGGICALHPRKDAHAQSILRSSRWEISFSDVISPDASSVSVVLPNAAVAKYSFGRFMTISAQRVAFPIRRTRSPSADESSVPACPTLVSFPRRRLMCCTQNVLRTSRALSRSRKPFIVANALMDGGKEAFRR